MPVIFPFGEGKTEKIVFTFLVDKWFSESQFQKFISVGGKTRFKNKILSTAQVDLSAGRDEVHILVFRDLDNGENVNNVVKSFQDIVGFLVETWGFKPEEAEELQKNSIYKWEVPANLDFAGLRFVLHIANHTDGKPRVALRNQTSDGYILKIALDNRVLERFANESKVNTSPIVLFNIVTDKIPTVMRGEKIAFDESKDYLSAYLTATRFWVVKRTEEESRLVKIILERSWRYEEEYFRQVFKSWRIAIEEVVK